VTTTTTDAAASAAIYAATKELRLPVVRSDSARLAEVAQRSQLSYLGFLAEVLSAEVDRRSEHRRRRRVTEARFPRLKRLADFDLGAAPSVNPATIATLASCAYLEAGDPVVLLGDSGTGKSHLLIGLGLAACERGKRVRYATCAQLVNELAEAADERRLSRLVARYSRVDLLCLDEFGYVQLDARGSELLFQILAEREEKSSIALASNLPFSKAHRFARTCARWRLKCTGPLFGQFKPPSVDAVGEVANEALGFHAERFADDLRVHGRNETDDPCRT
jgi:DNA replication protein DnaC